MAICVKRTDKLLFTEGITAHFIASLELFEGGDAFIIIKLPSGLQVSLIIYIGIVADILRISLSLYKL